MTPSANTGTVIKMRQRSQAPTHKRWRYCVERQAYSVAQWDFLKWDGEETCPLEHLCSPLFPTDCIRSHHVCVPNNLWELSSGHRTLLTLALKYMCCSWLRKWMLHSVDFMWQGRRIWSREFWSELLVWHKLLRRNTEYDIYKVNCQVC